MKKISIFLISILCLMTLCSCKANNKEQTDLDYVKEKGVLVVGITDFAPMDYKENNEWIGFDADMAKAFGDKLGVAVEFVEINWDNKILELNGKSIDCVWNGMTLTDEVKNAMATSNPYCNNAQIVVTNKENVEKFISVESLKDAQIAVEAGSAGQEVLSTLGVEPIALETQAAAVMEVGTNTSDACVIDALMAGAMIGDGTSYPNLVTTISLNSEEYGVGFRKDSNLVNELNEFFKQMYNDGTMLNIAKKYGVDVSIIAQ